jgi:hypothetical protein
MILEAIHTVGVIYSYWSDFIEEGYEDAYEMISYRHLSFQRTSEAINKLNNFIKVLASLTKLEYRRQGVWIQSNKVHWKSR